MWSRISWNVDPECKCKKFFYSTGVYNWFIFISSFWRIYWQVFTCILHADLEQGLKCFPSPPVVHHIIQIAAQVAQQLLALKQEVGRNQDNYVQITATNVTGRLTWVLSFWRYRKSPAVTLLICKVITKCRTANLFFFKHLNMKTLWKKSNNMTRQY